jgi:class 3 adenylate cyclase
VLEFLREYHGTLGPLVSQFEGTLDQFSGDGIMVFFNDPVPIPDPAERAVKTVCNVAARLCAEATDGQILLSQRVNVALRRSVATEEVGALALKGLTQPVVAYNVPLAATQAGAVQRNHRPLSEGRRRPA